MAWLPNPIACDVCGVIKQDSNHWYYAETIPEPNEEFRISPWDYPAEDRSRALIHLCGRVCVGKALDKWMDSLIPEPQPQAQSGKS